MNIEKILKTRNWTGLTIKQLAQAGRLAGNEQEVATKLLEQTENAVFDSQKETIKDFAQRWMKLINKLETEIVKLSI